MVQKAPMKKWNYLDTSLNSITRISGKSFHFPEPFSSSSTWRLWWLILSVNLAGPRCPVICSDIILDISVRVFVDENNT